MEWNVFSLLERTSVILTEVQLPSVKNINGNLSIIIIDSAIAQIEKKRESINKSATRDYRCMTK